MPICETVSMIAKRLEEQLPGPTANQLKMLAVLKAMPDYKQRGELPLWNADYKSSRNKDEKSTPNFAAIELVYELGRYNLFGEFDEDGVLRRYHITVAELARRNISVNRDLDVSEW